MVSVFTLAENDCRVCVVSRCQHFRCFVTPSTPLRHFPTVIALQATAGRLVSAHLPCLPSSDPRSVCCSCARRGRRRRAGGRAARDAGGDAAAGAGRRRARGPPARPHRGAEVQVTSRSRQRPPGSWRQLGRGFSCQPPAPAGPGRSCPASRSCWPGSAAVRSHGQPACPPSAGGGGGGGAAGRGRVRAPQTATVTQ